MKKQQLLCSVQHCNRKHFARGYCDPHYRRFRRGTSTKGSIKKYKKNSGKFLGLTDSGYIGVTINGIYRPEHTWVAMVALGKQLPKGAEVHHVNGIKHDNRPENLVVCPTHAYHKLIEARTKAYEECGHADWLRCSICKRYDKVSNFKLYGKRSRRHLNCTKLVVSQVNIGQPDDYPMFLLSEAG